METKEIGLEIVQIRLIQDRIVYNEKPIHSPQDAVEILGNEIKDYDREVLCVLNLDAHGVVQNANIVSMGTVNQTVSSPREIFKSAILSNAHSIIGGRTGESYSFREHELIKPFSDTKIAAEEKNVKEETAEYIIPKKKKSKQRGR